MNANFSVRPPVPRGPSDIASIDSPDAKQSADQACDIVMVLGPDMSPDFAAALNEAQRLHGGRVLVLDTASQGRNEVRARFHASLKSGARTELFLAFHGQVVDGMHHVQVDGAKERTLDFIDWLRTAPDGDPEKWTGRATLHSCSVLHAAEDAKPGTPAWDDGECIVIGGKGSVLQQGGIRVYRDMFDRILQGRGRDKAPDTTELLALAASLSGSAVAVFGGSRPQALSFKASESFSLMHDIYLAGETKRQEALTAYDRKDAMSGASAQSETSRVKRAVHDIALMGARRMREKSVARLMHLLFGRKLDKAADLIAVYPELMFVRLTPVLSNAALFQHFGLPPDGIKELWEIANWQIHRAYSDAETARLLNLPGTEMNHDEHLLKLVCRSQACLNAVQAELGKDQFQKLIRELLQVACAHGYCSELEMLIRAWSDINARDGNGNSL